MSGSDIRLQAFVAGVTVKTLSRATRIPYERVQRLLRGERTPKPGEMERLAAVVAAGQR
jgi:hypothetical protein